MSIQSIATKFRRALCNGTGATFSYAQMAIMARCGVLALLAEAEVKELLSAIDDSKTTEEEN